MASYSWNAPDGVLKEGIATIRDISDRGVFVIGEVTPALNALVEVHVYLHAYLPSLKTGGGQAAQLHGEGAVVRVDREAEVTTGFAATVAFRTEIASATTVMNFKRVN